MNPPNSNDLESRINRLKKVLIQESPILFLGAGFNFGGKLSNGSSIPLGNQLKEIILRDLFKIDATDESYEELINYNLSQICATFEYTYSKDELTDYLSDLFTNVKPAKYHYLLNEYYWKKIYTTNIDDMVENIFDKNDNPIYTQHSKRKILNKKDKATEYLKLHGSVRNPSEGFVFSTNDYVNSIITSADYRFNTLSVDMHSEHFIFIGTNFEEFNLEYYLNLYENMGYSSSHGKLFFINPKPSILLRKRIEKAKGILIEWNTEEFFNFIQSIKNEGSKINEYSIQKDLENLQFENLDIIKKNIDDLKSYRSELYFGYEPLWKDIFSDWDFLNNNINSSFSSFVDSLSYEKSGLFIIVGKAYSGKSTFIKRLGFNLLSKGYETFSFTGRVFSYYQFYQYINKSSLLKFALIIDNAGYNYSLIKQLLNMIPKDKQLIIIAASRPYHHIRYRYNILGVTFKEFTFDNLLDQEYAKNILDRLEDKGYLGDLSKINNDGDRAESILSNNDVMSTLFNITYGKGFIERLNNDLYPLLKEDSETKDLLISLSIFSTLELSGYPIELLSQITNNKTKYFLDKIDNFIKYTNNKNIQLRSSFFTTNILRSTTKERINKQIEHVLIAISTQVDDKSHTYWNEIHAALIKEKSLRKVFNFTNKEINNLLINVQKYYNNNFNYWIQLGLVEQRNKKYDKALNHFKVAESLGPNSYMVKNAIGRNFLKQANSFDRYNTAKPYFSQGETILKNLIEDREEYQVRAFSTHCYLYEKISFIKKFSLDISNKEVRELYKYLENINSKYPDDIMSRHINNFFYSFLKSIGKNNLISIKFQDLSRLNSVYRNVTTNFSELLDEIEVE